jgi:hypothetical protein
MAYLDDLVACVNQLFDNQDDIEALRLKVITLVQDKSRESFKNGLQAARNRKNKTAKSKYRKANK